MRPLRAGPVHPPALVDTTGPHNAPTMRLPGAHSASILRAHVWVRVRLADDAPGMRPLGARYVPCLGFNDIRLNSLVPSAAHNARTMRQLCVETLRRRNLWAKMHVRDAH